MLVRAMPLKKFLVSIAILSISLNISGSFSFCEPLLFPGLYNSVIQDTLKNNQILYNGRIWRNLHYRVDGHQFLFSDSFLPGTLVVRGKEFKDVTLKYDALKDEVLIPGNTGRILQLNKEMVDSFIIFWQNKKYLFTKPLEHIETGYVNLIYKGKSALYVKYSKRIEILADQGKVDKFYQTSQIYYAKDSIMHPVDGRRDLMKILKEDKDLVRSILRNNKLKISKNSPDSFIPLIQYLDNNRQPVLR